MFYLSVRKFHIHMEKYLSAIVMMALILVSSAVADMVLLDEYWTQEIVNNEVKVTEIDTLETGDPMQAKSGEYSALLENDRGWPSVRFRGGSRVVLSEIPPGDSEIRVWYRTDGWDGKWRLEIWLHNYHPSTPIPLKVLEGMLDGGGENGKIIADDKWHQARAVLQKGDGYDEMPQDKPLGSYIWLAPQEYGYDTPHRTYVDRVEVAVVSGPLKGKPAPAPLRRVRPNPGAQMNGNGWIWWEAENAVKHTFPPGGAYRPDNAVEQKKLSNGSWLQYHGGEHSAAWEVNVPEAGEYALWARGFWHEEPIKWRWDEGEWHTSEMDTKQDVRDAFWGMITVSWLNLGDVKLAAGRHRLEAEASMAEQTAFDCWLLTKGDFAPNGVNMPDQKDEGGSLVEEKEVNMYEMRIVEFPETMRVAYYQYIGKNPEDKAMGNIVDWARKNNLTKGDKLPQFFGFNNPNPEKGNPVYGFEGWVTIGDRAVESDGLVGIKTVPGGKYAVMRTKGVEWKKHDPDGKWMKENGYEYDKNRQWLEGHIPNPEDMGEGSSGEPGWIAFDLSVPIKPAEERGEVSDKSDSLILEGVPPVGFNTYQWCPFSGCLRSCMEFLGEGYSYEYILGTAGSAYRLQWNSTKWDGGNVGIMHMAENPIEPFIRAFKAVGYDHEILIRKDFARGNDSVPVSDDESVYRQRIISSIKKGHPVIAIGVVGPPEPCIITGYDEGGDILIGWSYFQETPFDAPKEYFRKSNWFLETYGIIVIGEKQEEPSLSEIYRSSLEWALVVARTRKIRQFHSGPAAYDAWAEAMTQDEDFPADNLNVLRNRLMVHYDAMCMANQRGRAAKFLRQVAEHEPVMAEELTEAARLYDAEDKALGKMHEATGGYIPRHSDEKVQNLANTEARKKIAAAILQARDIDLEAANHIEQALAKGEN